MALNEHDRLNRLNAEGAEMCSPSDSSRKSSSIASLEVNLFDLYEITTLAVVFVNRRGQLGSNS
jgi:hypothetical protein